MGISHIICHAQLIALYGTTCNRKSPAGFDAHKNTGSKKTIQACSNSRSLWRYKIVLAAWLQRNEFSHLDPAFMRNIVSIGRIVKPKYWHKKSLNRANSWQLLILGIASSRHCSATNSLKRGRWLEIVEGLRPICSIGPTIPPTTVRWKQPISVDTVWHQRPPICHVHEL